MQRFIHGGFEFRGSASRNFEIARFKTQVEMTETSMFPPITTLERELELPRFGRRRPVSSHLYSRRIVFSISKYA